jgi:hypothetical protein
LVAQHADVGDRLTTVGEHHRDIDEHPATVMDRGEQPTGERDGQPVGQADPICQQAQRD